MTKAAAAVGEDTKALVHQAAAGDEVAFARLATLVRPRMYRWALVQLLDADAAEDVTQRALIRLRNALPRFRGDSAPETWMFTIVRSATADWRRSERRRTEMQKRNQKLQEAFPEHGAPLDTGLDDTASELMSAVTTHIGVLPARQREVFDLVDLQGHTSLEAAELLSITPTTVRVHLMRARRVIRAKLLQNNAPLVGGRR